MESILDKKIDDCGFSVRTTNLLKNQGIFSVESMIITPRRDLLMHGFGKLSLGELEEFVAKNGLIWV